MFGRKKKCPHPTAGDFYHYHFGTEFNNGAMEFTFEPNFDLPVISFRGAGRLAGALKPLQPTPVYLSTLRVPVAGFGGIQAGQFVHQSLTDSPFGG
jgi:hypothetical protein